MNVDIYVDADKKDTLAAAAFGRQRVRGRDRAKPFRFEPTAGLSHRNSQF